MDYSHTQATHDEVNLLRLVQRLEKFVASEQEWNDTVEAQREKMWLQALGTLQKVNYGRKILRNLEHYDTQPTSKQARQRIDLKAKLDKIQLFVTRVQNRTEPPQQRPEPVLPKLPVPTDIIQQSESDSKPGSDSIVEREGWTGVSSAEGPKESIRLLSQVEGRCSRTLNDSTETSLSTPPPSSPPVSTLLPTTPIESTPLPLSSSTALPTSSNATKRKHLQITNALQEELSDQLALMAAQLKRNVQYFSVSLEKDKDVIEETQDKIDGNFSLMLKERIQLRDFRTRSKGSTWMVIGVVVIVLALFVVMVGVIRFSRR
ncbi:hypothetical protein Ac2012v2_001688 [Leucoagaricus gongylophorus]